MTLRVLDLFSGIGGFSLGLERAGMRTVAFCEIDPYCRAVLRKHWPAVPCFEDVRNLHAFDVGPVDVICGGFPCQDISTAGRGGGLAGARSGLWSEYRRLIEECRPAWAIIENVSAIRSRGLDTVLGELAALGYDAEWHSIPASALGAPHRRDRVWIVAHPADQLRRQDGRSVARGEGCEEGEACAWRVWQGHRGAGDDGPPEGGSDVADTYLDARLARWLGDAIEGARGRNTGGGSLGQDVHEGRPVHDAMLGRHRAPEGIVQAGRDGAIDASGWLVEPDVGRVANGVPSRVDRLRSLGNAVVPQIPQIIGRAILEAEAVIRPNS